MASVLTIETSDNALSYTNNNSIRSGENVCWTAKFSLSNNIKKTSTSGFLIKTQKGRNRVNVDLVLIDNEAQLSSILEIAQYQTPIDVTFDRNIILRQTTSGRFNVVDYSIKQEFDEGGQFEISLKLVEVLSQ